MRKAFLPVAYSSGTFKTWSAAPGLALEAKSRRSEAEMLKSLDVRSGMTASCWASVPCFPVRGTPYRYLPIGCLPIGCRLAGEHTRTIP